jgi:hypothetical protein
MARAAAWIENSTSIGRSTASMGDLNLTDILTALN